VGNPVATGGNLEVFLTGANFNNQFFFLPTGNSPTTGKPFWTGDGTKGFKYKDGKGDNGPVKSVRIRKSPSGQFSMKAVILGKLGNVTLVPPNPGTSSCARLDLGGGAQYAVKFAAGDGTVQNKGAALYKHKKPQFEGSCGFISSTTSSTAIVTTTTSTTSTTLYGSPSRAFLERVAGLLD
jgi:hypothetical protein